MRWLVLRPSEEMTVETNNIWGQEHWVGWWGWKRLFFGDSPLEIEDPQPIGHLVRA